MRSLAIVIGLPAVTIIVVSLFAMGGVARVAACILLLGSLATAAYLATRKKPAI